MAARKRLLFAVFSLAFAAACAGGPLPGPQDPARPERSARGAYSIQRTVHLDPGGTATFKLKDGTLKKIRLVSAGEVRDPVVGLLRRAEVNLEIDGKPLLLACAPYVMPAEIGGLRIQADTTSAWTILPAAVQLSLWDASDPIVDTARFGFPLARYGLFTQGTQGYNEPVHLGFRDGDPEGQRFYHNYGFDLAGYEGRDQVVACTSGTVIARDPNPEPGAVVVADRGGLIWHYGHLDSIDAAVKEGAAVRKGQVLGRLGRAGPSGNFSHLHVGVFASRADFEAYEPDRTLNLYPWLAAAYLAETGARLLAVARPHQVAFTGDAVKFDGTRSLAIGSGIASYQWVFHDGAAAEGPRAERVFTEPGSYAASLWVADREGRRDVDFCSVRVFTRGKPEAAIPTIFMTCHPSARVRTGEPVFFRFWLQDEEEAPLRVEFSDGTVIGAVRSFEELSRAFPDPGIQVVTASATVRRLPVMQKIKLLVEE